MIKAVTKFEVLKRGRERGQWLIEFGSKSKSKERRGERVNRLIEIGTKLYESKR